VRDFAETGAPRAFDGAEFGLWGCLPCGFGPDGTVAAISLRESGPAGVGDTAAHELLLKQPLGNRCNNLRARAGRPAVSGGGAVGRVGASATAPLPRNAGVGSDLTSTSPASLGSTLDDRMSNHAGARGRRSATAAANQSEAESSAESSDVNTSRPPFAKATLFSATSFCSRCFASLSPVSREGRAPSSASVMGNTDELLAPVPVSGSGGGSPSRVAKKTSPQPGPRKR